MDTKDTLTINGNTKPNLIADFKSHLARPIRTPIYGVCDYLDDDALEDLRVDSLFPNDEDDDTDFMGGCYSLLDSCETEEEWAKMRKALSHQFGLIDVDDDIPIHTSKKHKKHKTVSPAAKKKIEEKRAAKKREQEAIREMTDRKVIYYRDYNNQDDYEEFTNLFDFDEFCQSEGIDVSEVEVKNLMNRDVSYCCINPYDRRDGKVTLLSDSSYGGLRWSCAECDDELLNSY